MGGRQRREEEEEEDKEKEKREMTGRGKAPRLRCSSPSSSLYPFSFRSPTLLSNSGLHTQPSQLTIKSPAIIKKNNYKDTKFPSAAQPQ